MSSYNSSLNNGDKEFKVNAQNELTSSMTWTKYNPLEEDTETLCFTFHVNGKKSNSVQLENFILHWTNDDNNPLIGKFLSNRATYCFCKVQIHFLDSKENDIYCGKLTQKAGNNV